MTKFAKALQKYEKARRVDDAATRIMLTNYHFGYMCGMIQSAFDGVSDDDLEYFVEWLVETKTDPFEEGFEECLEEYYVYMAESSMD